MGEASAFSQRRAYGLDIDAIKPRSEEQTGTCRHTTPASSSTFCTLSTPEVQQGLNKPRSHDVSLHVLTAPRLPCVTRFQ